MTLNDGTRRRNFSGIVLLAFLVCAPSVAWADDVDETVEQQARNLHQEGTRLYAQGDNEGAIAVWLQAYELTGLTDILFNMAAAYERLGLYQDAVDCLVRYRTDANTPVDELDMRIERLRVRAEAERAVVDDPDEADTEPGADESTPDPANGQDAEPDATIESQLNGPDGPDSVNEQHEALSLETTELHLDPPLVLDASTVDVAATTGAALDPATVAFGAASVAMVLTGVGFGLASSSAAATVDELCAPGLTGTLCSPEADEHVRRQRRFGTVANVSYATGAALAVTALIVQIVRSPDGERSSTTSQGAVRITIAPTLFGAVMTGEF